MRILIIEDNPKMASAIQRGLRAEGFLADVSHSGFEGEDLARAEPYDGIILDMLLPDKDGVDVCKNLRRRGVRTPILFLSSLADVDNKLAGMNAGADDYMTKPFELEDLVARVRSLTHREARPACARLCLDDLELDPETRTVWRGGRQLDLSAKEFELLRFLLSNQEQPLTRRDIAEGVWNVELGEDSNVIDVYASMLRSKLGLDLSGRLQRMFEGVAGRAGPVH